jgi:HAD superfamily hydrolase (TIGR01509 family)
MLEIDERMMRQAINLAQQAYALNEVPVGAVIVKNGEIIGRGFNQPIATHDPSAHAEIQALRDAGSSMKNYRFPGATLYSTLEPCPMCAGAIIQARLTQVVYGTPDPKGGACGSKFDLLPSDSRFNHRTTCRSGILTEECSKLLQTFFQQRRNNSRVDDIELKALLFDVDGTLADTERDGHRIAFNRAFAKLSLDWCWSAELYGQLLAITGGRERLQHFIATMYPPLPALSDLNEFIAELHRCKTRIYNEILHTEGIPLRPGIARLLREAKATGLKLGIVTTTSRENVLTLLRITLGETAINWFDIIAAGEDVTTKKPAPDIYLYALQRLEINAANCIAFEDSAIGLQAAHKAGIDKVIITVTDYTRAQDFTGATLVVENLGEIDIPCQQLAGNFKIQGCVDVACLQKCYN